MQLMMIILLQTKCLMIKLRAFIFIVIIFHIIIVTVRFLMTGASDLISNSAHFSFITSTGHMILNISGIFKSILKDQYKCPACDKKINPRSVKKSNPIDKSLNKNAINEITLLYKYCHKKPRFFKKAYKRFKTLDLSCNLSSSYLIVGGTRAGGVTTNLYT